MRLEYKMHIAKSVDKLASRWGKSDRSTLPRDNNASGWADSSCMAEPKQPICRPVLFFYTIFNPIRWQGQPRADSADQPLAGIMVSCSHPVHPCHANRCARYGPSVERVKVAREGTVARPPLTYVNYICPSDPNPRSSTLYTEFPINSNVSSATRRKFRYSLNYFVADTLPKCLDISLDLSNSTNWNIV